MIGFKMREKYITMLICHFFECWPFIGSFFRKKLLKTMSDMTAPKLIEQSVCTVNRVKFLKYSLLRSRFGRVGRYYDMQYKKLINRVAVQSDFEEALHLCAGMICIDLGANVGKFTVRMASHASKVIAFEPDPFALSILQKNTANCRNVKIVQAAASVRNATTLLYRDFNFSLDPVRYSESSSICKDKRGIDVEQGIPISLIDFIEFIDKIDEPIGILKMDIEGAETEILERLFDRPELVNRIRYIFAETHENRIRSHKVRIQNLRYRQNDFSDCLVNLEWY